MSSLSKKTMLTCIVATLLFITAPTISNADEASSVQHLLARAEIEDSLNRYIHGLDSRDAKLYASAFAEDGILWFKDRRMQGHEEIEKFITDAGPQPQRLHILANSLIEFASDTEARVTSYFMTVEGDAITGFKTSLMGTYNDLFVKRGDKWLIMERKPAVFGPEPKN